MFPAVGYRNCDIELLRADVATWRISMNYESAVEVHVSNVTDNFAAGAKHDAPTIQI